MLIGFRRNVYLEWLEQTAALFCMAQDPAEVRERLDAVVALTVQSGVNRRQTLDILCNTWGPREGPAERLREEALRIYQETTANGQHVALHYGLTLMAFPFFREGARIVGQRLRFGGAVRTDEVRQQLLASLGNLGAAADAVKRIIFSLRNWGLLEDSGRRYAYQACEPRMALGTPDVERWLLAAALTAHPADELPFADLVRLPELFAFEFSLRPYDLAGASSLLDVYRSGGGWDAVRLRD
jgi:hypothetical protein